MEDLRAIISKANELVDQLMNKLSKIEPEKAEVAKQKAAVIEEKRNLEAIAKGLKEREEALKDHESASALREEAGEILEGVKAEKVSLGLDKEKFEKSCQEESKRLQDQADILKAAQRQLADDRAALNKERETYKKQVIDEVNKNLKARQ